LLNKAVWDTDAVAADLRDYVIEHLGEVDGVLVADETGDLKKGDHTVGVQRQYTGPRGTDRERRPESTWSRSI
jgi:SRSO17 transposase